MKNPDSDIDKNAVQLRVATQQDVENLVTLLNRCYRSDEGWTNEAALIGGIRTTPEEMTAMIDNRNVYLFVFENPHDSDDLLGCISVDFSPILTISQRHILALLRFILLCKVEALAIRCCLR